MWKIRKIGRKKQDAKNGESLGAAGRPTAAAQQRNEMKYILIVKADLPWCVIV